jgi:hypothetical protein
MKNLLIVFLLLFSCSKKKDAIVPVMASEELQAEIDRITPLLLWCDGQATGSGPNNIDGRPNCDVGDAAAESGFLTLVGNFQQEQGIFNAMKLSFASDDRPYRAPSYVGKDGSNTFSRDQLLGFIQATIAGLPVQDGLERIMNYHDKTGAMCPDSQACWITPGLKVIVKYAMGKSVNAAEKLVESSETLIEAQTVPMNYRADLVMKRIYTIVKLGKLTTTHAKAAKTVYEKAPNNIWFKTVYGITNNGSQELFEEAAKSLLDCMRQWNKPGTDWTYSKGNVACFTGEVGVYGHELVAVAHLLLNVQPVIASED